MAESPVSDWQGPPPSAVEATTQRLLAAYNLAVHGAWQPLAGGLMNHVWRVQVQATTPWPDDIHPPESLVVKHAPPHVASQPDVALSPERLMIEAKALHALGPDGVLSEVCWPGASVPQCWAADSEDAVLIVEDLGTEPELPMLTTALSRATAGQARGWGQSIGRFLGRLHTASVPLQARPHNDNIQRVRQRVQYLPVAERLTQAGHADLGQQVAGLGQRLLQPGTAWIMGDAWPASVRINGLGQVRWIDWEMSHWGQPCQDLGHLFAHLQLASHLPHAATCWAALRDTYGALAPAHLQGQALNDTALHALAEIEARTEGAFALPDGADRHRHVQATARARAHDPAWLMK